MALTVRAAGGIVVRQRGGKQEILLVHRPRYDDWTLPKGKAVPGESDQECALREVAEETGLRCQLGDELQPVTYRDARGRLKTVRYWLMTPGAGEFTPGSEVDETRWLTPDQAESVLTYDRDRDVLASLPAQG